MSKTSRYVQVAYGILDRMKGGRKARGFTIVETLVVLAVTGGLFAAVAVSLSGRQARTQFEQSVQAAKAQIQQVINDVAVGNYPANQNFNCIASPLGPTISSGSTRQGENSGCIFLGKVIQFDVASTDPEQFRVYALAGLLRDSTGAEVTSYSAAKPRVIAPSSSSPAVPDDSVKGILQYGLSTASMKYGATDIGAIAFVNNLASYSSGSIVSGSEQVNMIPVNTTSLGMTPAAAAQAINNQLASSPVNPSTGVKLCLADARVGESGLITIGSNGRQLSVTLSIKGNTTCS